MNEKRLRFLQPHVHLHAPFGSDAFGKRAEAFARFFGTPAFLFGQTLLVMLCNLAFSLQAAYAAPLILLAQTRQADRDRALAEADAMHREAIAQASLERNEIALEQGRKLEELLASNTRLTEESARLTERLEALTSEIHRRVCTAGRD